MSSDREGISRLLEQLEEQAGRKLTTEELKTFNLDLADLKVNVNEESENNNNAEIKADTPDQMNDFGINSVPRFSQIFGDGSKNHDDNLSRPNESMIAQQIPDMNGYKYEQDIPEEYSFIYNCPQGEPTPDESGGTNSVDILSQVYTPAVELTDEVIEQQPNITIPNQSDLTYYLTPSQEDLNGVNVINSQMIADINSFPTPEEVYRLREIDNTYIHNNDVEHNASYPNMWNSLGQMPGQMMPYQPSQSSQPFQQPETFNTFPGLQKSQPPQPLQSQIMNMYGNSMYGQVSGTPYTQQYYNPSMYPQQGWYGLDNMNNGQMNDLRPRENPPMTDISPVSSDQQLKQLRSEEADFETPLPVYEQLIANRQPMDVSMRRRRVCRGRRLAVNT